MTNKTLGIITKDNYSNWCAPLTESVYLYGYLVPAIALFIFGLTFNPIALYYFATSINFRRSAYSYYFSTIAVVDFIRLTIWFSFFILDFKVLKLNFYSFECSAQIFTESVTSSISAWLTVFLTLERCLVIYKPLQTLTDMRRKRTLIVILCVIVVSCAANGLVLQPGFYIKRVYRELTYTIVCHYEHVIVTNQTNSTQYSLFTANTKRIYLLLIVIFRVVVAFVLLLTANITLFVSVRQNRRESVSFASSSLVRHGHHRQVTPMIFFSSCILLLTVSPRYLLQFYLNFYRKPPNCFLTHFAPHLLKTLELSNYAFNVFVSIVSGKHGRSELFQMLFCRPSTPTNMRLKNGSKFIQLTSATHSMIRTRCRSQHGSNRRHNNNHYRKHHTQYV